MGLIQIALRRPIMVLMLFLVPVTLGFLAFPRLPVERFPRTNFPFVFIQVSYPGAAPEDVERQITELLEDSMIGISGADHVTSNSSQGNANVSISFSEDTDLTAALVAVERRLNSVRRRLPAAAGDPSINTAGANAFPIMNIALSSDRLTLTELFQIANDQISPQLQSVNGVADVSVSGGRSPELQVRVDPTRMQTYGVSLTQIQNAIRNWNLTAPAGNTRTDTQVFNTRTMALAETLGDLERIVVTNTATGPVFLRDVASVVETSDVVNSFQRLNGNDSVGLRVTQASGANSIQVSAELRERLDTLISGYGASGIVATITSEQARFTRAAVDDTTRSLYMAVLFAGLVLILFLHNFRNTFIVLIAIPASLIPTFFVMHLMGVGLNTVSLMGLALVVGILVDDSIVVIENINRHLKLGESPWDAVVNGVSEIGLAVAAITLATVAVFVPLVFLGGNVGRLFRELGLTMAVATFFSLLVSLLLTPMLASRMLKEAEELSGRGPWAAFSRAWERGFESLRHGYRMLLSGALRVRWLPVLIGFAMLGAVLTLVGANPLVPVRMVSTEFSPREDNSGFQVNISMPQGTSLQVTNDATRVVEARLATLPEVESLSTSVRQQSASINVDLVDKAHRSRSVFEIVNDVRSMGADIPAAQVRTQVPSALGGPGGGGGGGINLIARGPDIKVLETVANDVLRIIREVPGTAEARTSAFVPVPEYRAVVDPQRAADLGVNPNTIGTTLNAAISGSEVSAFRPAGGSQIDIVVKLEGAERLTPADLGAIPIQTSRQTTVRLDQVARIVPGTGPTQISRYDRQRQVQIQATVTDRPFGDIIDDISKRLKELQLPVGYSVTVGGQGSQLNAAFAALLGAMVLSIVFMFMVLAALYESLIYPWAVVLCLPVALVGALGGLIITGNTVNIFSMMGIILLVGLVAKNAILLVDYTNTLRKRGLPREAAILEAGPTRLRPIMMTSLTIVFALLPLTFKLGEGAESRAPLAVVVIGGVITSTLLTLVMVPCAYTYLDDLQIFLLRMGAWFRGSPVVPVPVLVGDAGIAAGNRGTHVRGQELRGEQLAAAAPLAASPASPEPTPAAAAAAGGRGSGATGGSGPSGAAPVPATGNVATNGAEAPATTPAPPIENGATNGSATTRHPSGNGSASEAESEQART